MLANQRVWNSSYCECWLPLLPFYTEPPNHAWLVMEKSRLNIYLLHTHRFLLIYLSSNFCQRWSLHHSRSDHSTTYEIRLNPKQTLILHINLWGENIEHVHFHHHFITFSSKSCLLKYLILQNGFKARNPLPYQMAHLRYLKSGLCLYP